MDEEISKPTSVASAASTPGNGPQKKKITLSDYREKAKGAPVSLYGEDTAAKNARTSPTITSNAKFQALDPKNNELKVPSKPKDVSVSVSGSHSSNVNGTAERKLSLEDTSRSSRPAKERESPPFGKKPRPSTKLLRGMDQSSPNAKNAAQAVPDLLSPTLPPTTTSPKVPRLLSPTLPPDIEEELAKMDESSQKVVSIPQSLSNLPGSKDCDTNSKSVEPTRPHSASSNKSFNTKITPSAALKVPIGGSKSGLPEEKSPHPVDKISRRTLSEAPGKTSVSSPDLTKPNRVISTKPKLIVKLRYGRVNRKRIEALLRFSGKRRPVAEYPPPRQKMGLESSSRNKEGNEPPHLPKPMEKPRLSPTPSRGEKRANNLADADAQAPASKRPKAIPNTASTERSRTPISSALKSSSSHQQQATSKMQFLTPRKELKGVAMRRLGSGDSDGKSPTGMVSTSTPGRIEKVTKPSPPTSVDHQPNKSRDIERRAWRDEFQKYVNLGRELKHAAERHGGLKATDEPAVEPDDKLGAAIAIEAILCFILAFITDDKCKALGRQVGDSTAWRSILAYWHAVRNITTPYPHLHGLCVLLGAVSHDAIHGLDLERLAVSAIPGEHSPAPTPGSDGNTVTSDESKKYKKEFIELKARLPESYREAHRLWLEGTRELSDEVLASQYPVTWSRRSKNFTERGKEKLKLGEYSGEFFLPLGRTTTPLEAVRFGWSFLCEWCEKEEVNWKGRLGL
jgi:hypothetical protein